MECAYPLLCISTASILFVTDKKLGNMRRLTTIEKSAVALGLAFVAVGVFMIVYPTEDLVFHTVPDKHRANHQPEVLSKLSSQIFGGIAVVVGAGITWLACYRGGK